MNIRPQPKWRGPRIGIRAFPLFVFIAVQMLVLSEAQLFADLVIDFENPTDAAQFDGDQAGNDAGPFNIDGSDVILTTTNVSGTISTSSFGLGIDNGGSDPDTSSFNIGESWSFSTDTHLLLMGLEIGGLQSEENFELKSDLWIGLAGVTTGSGVTYDSLTGTFTLTDGPANDLFTLTELTGGVLLPFSPSSEITLGNLTSTFGPNDDVELENITFQLNPVPEPSGLGLWVIASMGIIYRRKRSAKK